MCFGGSAPAAPPPPPPPPQYAQAPAAAAVRADTATQNAAPQNGTILTGGMGDTTALGNELGKNTLLGQ